MDDLVLFVEIADGWKSLLNQLPGDFYLIGSTPPRREAVHSVLSGPRAK